MNIEKRVKQVNGNDRQKLELGVRNFRMYGDKFMRGLDDEGLKDNILKEIELRKVRQERRIEEADYDRMRRETY